MEQNHQPAVAQQQNESEHDGSIRPNTGEFHNQEELETFQCKPAPGAGLDEDQTVDLCPSTDERQASPVCVQKERESRRVSTIKFHKESIHSNRDYSEQDNFEELTRSNSQVIFEELDAKVQMQVKKEKDQKQQRAGQKIAQLCYQIGRCPICTLVPPCNHQQQLGQNNSSQIDVHLRPFRSIEKHSDNPSPQLFDQSQQSQLTLNQPTWQPKNPTGEKIQSDMKFKPQQVPLRGFANPQLIDHHQKMARMQHKSNVYFQPTSPIIHQPSDFYEISQEKNNLEHMYSNIGNNHSNRAQALRQMHLKKIIKENSSAFPTSQFVSGSAYLDQSSPLNDQSQIINDPSMHYPSQAKPQMRIRDSSGIYNSIDTSLDHDTSILSYKDIQSAETRLRTIEMISKYRENKIKREFIKLEFDLKSQEERVKLEQQKILTRKKFLDQQKTKVEEFRLKKVQEENELLERALNMEKTQKRKEKLHVAQVKQQIEHMKRTINEGVNPLAMKINSPRNDQEKFKEVETIRIRKEEKEIPVQSVRVHQSKSPKMIQHSMKFRMPKSTRNMIGKTLRESHDRAVKSYLTGTPDLDEVFFKSSSKNQIQFQKGQKVMRTDRSSIQVQDSQDIKRN